MARGWTKSAVLAAGTLVTLLAAIPADAQTTGVGTPAESAETAPVGEAGRQQPTLPSVVGAPGGFQPDESAVVGGPPPPQIESEAFTDWRLECYEPAINGLRCQVVQQLVERNLNEIVLLNSLVFVPQTELTQIQVVLPTGFLLKRGVTFEVGGYTTTVGVDRCTPQGCFIEGIAAPELLDAMRRAREARVSIVADTGQTIRIPFSLMGFTAAFDAMRERNLAFAAEAVADAEADGERDGEDGATADAPR